MARILIVDNEKDTVDIFSIAVRMLGHTPIGALSGPEALDLVAQDTPDLILLDYFMPELDGIETLRRIRRLKRGEDVPAVLVTASPDTGLEEQIAFAGGNGCIQKPLSLNMLSEIVVRFTRGASADGSVLSPYGA